MSQARLTFLALLTLGVILHYAAIAAGGKVASVALLGFSVLAAGAAATLLGTGGRLRSSVEVVAAAVLLFVVGDVAFGAMGYYSGAWPGALSSLLAAALALPAFVLFALIGSVLASGLEKHRKGRRADV